MVPTEPPTLNNMAHLSGPRHTALEDLHRESGATLTEYAGWRLPLRFSGDLAEHRAVREHAGLFDISHMGQLSVRGADAARALSRALVSDVTRLGVGRARYTMVTTPSGGVIDDLIVYRLAIDELLVIANAANTRAVLAALGDRLASFAAELVDRTDDRALIALQGPAAVGVLSAVSDGALPTRFGVSPIAVAGRPVLAARTGYTGEDGFELSVAHDDASTVWLALLETGAPEGVARAGLAARDSLRLEAGLPLYGHELGLERSPFAAGYGHVVDLGPGREFVGDAALRAIAERGEAEALVGLLGESGRAPRQGYAVLGADGSRIGTVTSGGPSPTLGRPIAMAYCKTPLPPPGTAVMVDVRGRPERATVSPLPFYRRPEPTRRS